MQNPLFKPFWDLNTHANRGTVAIIGWNTLNAPTWYVTGENLDGEVSLGGTNSKTLLAINFNEYTISGTNELKEIELNGVSKVDDRQIVIAKSILDKIDTDFATEFDSVPKKNKEEKSFIDGTDVYIYVPEEVFGNLDSLKNKKFTIILGEDEIAALVILEDDVLETAFLTKYDDEKITVGGETYKLALDSNDDVDYKVEVNGYTGYADLDTALTAIDSKMDYKDIEKKIEATVTLNGDNKVSLVELFVSDTVANTAEVLVTKVKETSKNYTITTTGKELTWKVEDEEEKDFSFPAIYIDGVKGDIRDIEAGNVLTIIKDKDSDNDVAYDGTAIAKIYVSTNTVTGEATRVKKANNAITIDGEVYTRTAEGVKATEDELKDNKFTADYTTQDILDSDEVTLYLNIYGEYVAIALTETESSYTFGVVTFVSSNTNWDGEEEDILTRKIKVLLVDGKKTSYTVTVDTSDKDIDAAAAAKITTLVDKNGDPVTATAQNFLDEDYLPAVGEFIMFEATADNTVVIEEGNEFKALTDADAGKLANDYILTTWNAGSVSKNDKEFTATYGSDTIEAEYDANETVIFNTTEQEIVTKWSAILKDQDPTNFADNTFVIFADEDDEVPAYIVVAIADGSYASSDAQYAVVEKSAYHEGDEYYVDLLDNEGVEVKSTILSKVGEATVNTFIEYKMQSAKMSDAAVLVDVEALAEVELEDKIPAGIIKDGFETKSVLALDVREVAIEATAVKGAYVTGDHKDLFETGDANAVLATYEFKSVFPATAESGDKYHIVQKNQALAAAYPTEFASGEKAKTYVIGTDAQAGEELVVLVKDATNVTVEVYEGENATGRLIAKYTITDPEVKTVEAGEETAPVVVENVLAKENLTLAESKEYNDYIKLSYKEFEDEDHAEKLASVKADKDAKVYDLREGGCAELTMADLVDLVAEDILVLPFKNVDCDEDAEANVFVIVD